MLFLERWLNTASPLLPCFVRLFVRNTGLHREPAVVVAALPEARRILVRAAPGHLRAPHGRAGLRVGAELVRPVGGGARQEAGFSGDWMMFCGFVLFLSVWDCVLRH